MWYNAETRSYEEQGCMVEDTVRKRVNVTLNDEQYDAVQRLADSLGISLASAARVFLKRGIELGPVLKTESAASAKK
jgi:hypothetical protein